MNKLSCTQVEDAIDAMNGQAVVTVAAVNPVVRPHARPPAIELHVLLRLAGQPVFRPPAGAPHAVRARVLRLHVAVMLAVCTSAGDGDRRGGGLILVAKQSKMIRHIVLLRY